MVQNFLFFFINIYDIVTENKLLVQQAWLLMDISLPP